VPRRIPRDRIQGAVFGVVEVVLCEEDEVAGSSLERRRERIRTEDGAESVGVAREADVARARSPKQPVLGTFDGDRKAVFRAVSDVASIAAGCAAVVEGGQRNYRQERERYEDGQRSKTLSTGDTFHEFSISVFTVRDIGGTRSAPHSRHTLDEPFL
jgi:hypothetical protein